VIACHTRTAATASADRPRRTGIPLHDFRTVLAGGANIAVGAGEMLFTLTLMTSRPYLTKMQNDLTHNFQSISYQYLMILFQDAKNLHILLVSNPLRLQAAFSRVQRRFCRPAVTIRVASDGDKSQSRHVAT
jgi:hypothetical protein